LSFFLGKDVGSHNLPIAEKELNTLPFYDSKNLVCARKAKNLTTTLEINTGVGDERKQKAKGKILEFIWKLQKEGYR